jgi:hypothetical protein
MTIPAIRVELNGQLVTIAGAEGLAMLTTTFGLGAAKGNHIDPTKVLFNVMGLDIHGKPPRQLTWGSNLALRPGDRVTLEIVQVDQPSFPDQVLVTPSAEQLKAEASRPTRKRKEKD